MKDYRLAATFYKQALMVFRNQFGDDHPVTRKTMNKLSALGPEVEDEKTE